MYWPTETTVWSLVESVVGEGPITIGHPIANTSLYVLDPRSCPVPPGVTGELFIGGSGVTRGYWKRDELNRDRFVPNPYAQEPGARMYKTGDLVRLRWDGRLEWLGRSDFQVKVRGYRIELPEIEAALSALPGVLEAVVIVREDRKNDQRIVGYVRAAGEAELDPERMIDALRGNLPGYMVPQHVVPLKAFPQTPNGKIDRKVLPAPLAGATSSKPPSTEVEKAVAEAVQELLGVERVGLDSDFFALGGHSLLAQRLTLRVRDRFGIEMPLRTIFSQPTVGALADFVQAGVSLRAAPASTDMAAAGETEVFVL
jgi:acyl carrier protein